MAQSPPVLPPALNAPDPKTVAVPHRQGPCGPQPSRDTAGMPGSGAPTPQPAGLDVAHTMPTPAPKEP